MSWIEEGGPEDLQVDEARLYLIAEIGVPLDLSTKYEECTNCPFQLMHGNQDSNVYEYKLSTKSALTLQVTSSGVPVCPDIKADFGEFGVYNLTVQHDVLNENCTLETVQDPVNIYYPLILICICLLCIAVLATTITHYVKRHYGQKDASRTIDLDNSIVPNGGGRQSNRKRVESIDTLRGIAILMMIFVNDGGGQYVLLEHTPWDGLHMADLCFPWFMWIMGVCIPISLKNNLKRGIPRWKMFTNIFKRSVILFGLGLMLNTVGGGTNFDYLRIPGVLQRFSLVYLIIATIALFGMLEYKDQEPGDLSALKKYKECRDVLVVAWLWIAVVIFVTIHTCLIFLGEVPDCPTGYLGTGNAENCTGGMTGYVDKVILGVDHIYHYPTCYEVYNCGPFDPEGILGILTSCLSVMLGVQAGSTLLHFYSLGERLFRWCLWGVITAILAASLAGSGVIPINKNLWSLSFVFTTSSAAFFVLSIIYLLQDHWRIWNGVPFKGPGMNPTILYVGHEIVYNLFPFHFRQGINNTHFFFTLETLWGVALWTVIAYVLYFNKFFLSV